jgi:hypothetical protein
MVLQLASVAERVHRRGRDAQPPGDLTYGQLDAPRADSERVSKGVSKLRASCCGLVRQVREGEMV